MTNEEAKEELIQSLTDNHIPDPEAVEMAIKALEQEPCEDAISRQAALDCFTATKLKKFDFILYAREEIKKLPPVNPQPKTGHWIPVSERLPEKYAYTLWCASSGCVRSDYFNGEFWEDAEKYCYEVIAWMPLPTPFEAEREVQE